MPAWYEHAFPALAEYTAAEVGPGPYIRTLYLRPHDCDTLVHCRELTSNQPCLSKLLQTSWNWFWHAGQRSNMVTHVLNTHSDWLISLFADHPSCYTDHRHWFKLVQTASYYILRHACLIWHDAWDKVNKTTWPFSCSCWCLSVLCKTSHTSNALSIFCCLHVMCNTSITRCAVKWKYS